MPALTEIQSVGGPFIVMTPTNLHVLVSSEKHIKELVDAPAVHLSLHAVAKEASTTNAALSNEC